MIFSDHTSKLVVKHICLSVLKEHKKKATNRLSNSLKNPRESQEQVNWKFENPEIGKNCNCQCLQF